MTFKTCDTILMDCRSIIANKYKFVWIQSTTNSGNMSLVLDENAHHKNNKYLNRAHHKSMSTCIQTASNNLNLVTFGWTSWIV